jgi:hypothetical protein
MSFAHSATSMAGFPGTRQASKRARIAPPCGCYGSPHGSVLEDKVSACDVMLESIGPRWLTVTDERGADATTIHSTLFGSRSPIVTIRSAVIFALCVGSSSQATSESLDFRKSGAVEG